MVRPTSSPAAQAVRTALSLTLLLLALGCSRQRAEAPRGPSTASEAEETVNLGYGTSTRRDVTGAVSSGTAEQLRAGRPVSRVEEMIEGRFPGVDVVRVGGSYSIRIRGSRSLMGGNEPLIVVDGVPLSGRNVLDGINPGDVERIDVLKDASATATYGSRGANGVILITTRRPG